MVAPNYAEKRSALARQIGLGRKPAATQPVAEQPVKDAAAEVEPEVVASKEPKVRAKRKAAAAGTGE